MIIHCAANGSTALCGADFRATDDFILHHTPTWSLVLERWVTAAEAGINCTDCLTLLTEPVSAPTGTPRSHANPPGGTTGPQKPESGRMSRPNDTGDANLFRIQLRRTKGWRKPDNTIVVARPTKWGNPFYMPGHAAGRHDGLVYTPQFGDIYVLTRLDAVHAYERWLHLKVGRSGFALIEEARVELKGHNLACWCPLGEPCHADVLLRVANI